MKRALFALVLGAAALASPAYAQIAGAIGKPLTSPDLPAGTLSIRVVAGSPSKPVIGSDVTLIVNGAPRIARTDSAGRAHFKDLPAGATIQAKVLDEDKKEVASDEFPMPADNGARVLLTTRPWNPGGPAGGGGGAMGGAGGEAPNPRQMSGEPRPEGADSPGTFTVRLSYDDFKDAPPVGVPVALVGYKADNSVATQVKPSDSAGRAQFTGLDRSGATAYFALAMLPRGTGIDRLVSTPAVLDARGGVRLILSAEKRTSSLPNLDDLTRMEKQEGAPAAGKVRIVLEGGVESTWVVLVDAETKMPIGKAKPQMGMPDPSDVNANAAFTPRPDVPPGSVEVSVHGGIDNTDGALADVSIKIASVKDPNVFKEAQTTDNGRVTMKPGIEGEVVATVTVNGKPLTTKPFDLNQAGGVMDVEAHWASGGKPQVEFDLVPKPGQVVYAETLMHQNVYRTVPFQPLLDRGTRATLFIFPRLLFTFSLTSRIDDEYFAVNGRFEISNNSWIPYQGGPDGIIIPLPRGFTGGLVAEKDQGDISLEPKEGFRLVRPIAPGRRTWHGAFSLPNEDGHVSWSMDLPFGAFNSGMEILQVPGMTVVTPPGVDGQTMNVPQGTFFVLPQISILPRQSMVMSIAGLPAPPGWRVWLPRIAGVLVLLLVLGGIGFALFRARPTEADAAAREEKRQKLLDELVDIEKAGNQDSKRKERIVAELEKLWDEGDNSSFRPTS